MEDPMSKLTLHRFELDIDNYMVWLTDDRVSKIFRWETYTSHKAVLERLRDRTIPHPWLKAISLSEQPIAEIGFMRASQYWGQSIATHAVKMMVSSVFKDIPEQERIEAFVDKVGFLKEGLLRKYSINKGQTKDLLI
ncbi:hypothetical protein AMTRI_Chr08g168360 [Amborella trichopoda]